MVVVDVEDDDVLIGAVEVAEPAVVQQVDVDLLDDLAGAIDLELRVRLAEQNGGGLPEDVAAEIGRAQRGFRAAVDRRAAAAGVAVVAVDGLDRIDVQTRRGDDSVVTPGDLALRLVVDRRDRIGVGAQRIAFGARRCVQVDVLRVGLHQNAFDRSDLRVGLQQCLGDAADIDVALGARADPQAAGRGLGGGAAVEFVNQRRNLDTAAAEHGRAADVDAGQPVVGAFADVHPVAGAGVVGAGPRTEALGIGERMHVAVHVAARTHRERAAGLQGAADGGGGLEVDVGARVGVDPGAEAAGIGFRQRAAIRLHPAVDRQRTGRLDGGARGHRDRAGHLDGTAGIGVADRDEAAPRVGGQRRDDADGVGQDSDRAAVDDRARLDVERDGRCEGRVRVGALHVDEAAAAADGRRRDHAVTRRRADEVVGAGQVHVLDAGARRDVDHETLLAAALPAQVHALHLELVRPGGEAAGVEVRDRNAVLVFQREAAAVAAGHEIGAALDEATEVLVLHLLQAVPHFGKRAGAGAGNSQHRLVEGLGDSDALDRADT